MARARNIKPSFFTNEYLAELPYEARLLFIGLWTIADRRGRLEDRPKGIKGKLFPFDNVDMDGLLQQLSDSPERFIVRYEADGQRYIQITNFEKHQHPHHREAESTIPAPGKPGESLGLAPDKPHTSPSDSLNPYTLTPLPTYCTERSDAPDPPHRNPAIALTLNDKTEYPIFEEQTHEWAALYPAVDVIQQLRSMKGWLDANPTKRKTKTGIMKFVNSWLAREQDKGARASPQAPSQDFRQLN